MVAKLKLGCPVLRLACSSAAMGCKGPPRSASSKATRWGVTRCRFASRSAFARWMSRRAATGRTETVGADKGWPACEGASSEEY